MTRPLCMMCRWGRVIRRACSLVNPERIYCQWLNNRPVPPDIYFCSKFEQSTLAHVGPSGGYAPVGEGIDSCPVPQEKLYA